MPAMKRYFDYDLIKDEIYLVYPTKGNLNKGRRKRRFVKQTALELLAFAGQEAVKQTFTTAQSAQSSPSSSDFSVKNDPDLSPFSNRFQMNLSLGIPDENLTFKTLSEWSEELRKTGQKIVLPEDSIVAINFDSYDFDEEDDDQGDSLNDENEEHSEQSSTDEDGQGDDEDEQSTNDEQVESVPMLKQNNSQRLIIKLTRCNSDSVDCWRSVHSLMETSPVPQWS